DVPLRHLHHLGQPGGLARTGGALRIRRRGDADRVAAHRTGLRRGSHPAGGRCLGARRHPDQTACGGVSWRCPEGISMSAHDDKYEAVIGLEVHAQLLTRSKIFCGCSTEFGAPPNTHVCPVCSGMPGVLPVFNRHVLELAIRMGLAAHCTIAPHSIFDRKNYFYPDLPKGYQISQYETPLCKGGYIELPGEDGAAPTRIRLVRIHLEEDAGKNIHAPDCSLVDFNRSGVPLTEIVSEP